MIWQLRSCSKARLPLKYLSVRKAEWAKLRQGNKNQRLNMEFFLARFDPANYTKTPQENGRVLITMRWPDHLEKIATGSQEKGRLKSLLSLLRCAPDICWKARNP